MIEPGMYTFYDEYGDFSYWLVVEQSGDTVYQEYWCSEESSTLRQFRSGEIIEGSGVTWDTPQHYITEATWNTLENKPFELIGDGLSVDINGRLNATGSIITNVITVENVQSLNITDALPNPLGQFIIKNDLHRGPSIVGGRNQINVRTDVNGHYIDGSGIIRTSTTITDAYSQLIPCTPGDTVYAYAITSSVKSTRAVNKRLHCYDANGTWIRQLGVAAIPTATQSYPYEITGTIPSNCYYLRLSHATDETEVMVEFGSKTQYEPYNGVTPFLPINSLTYTYNSVAHTIDAPSTLTNGFYLAEIDVLNGIFYKTWECIDSYAGETLPGEWMSSYDIDYGQQSPSTGAQVIYELATPVAYNITPESITLLPGANSFSVTDGKIKIITYSTNSIRQGTLIADTALVIGNTTLTENQLRRLLQLIN